MTTGINSLSSFRKFSDELSEEDQLMPVLFVGHGSPMNGIEDNEFSKRWEKMGEEIPAPKFQAMYLRMTLQYVISDPRRSTISATA